MKNNFTDIKNIKCGDVIEWKRDDLIDIVKKDDV